MKVPTETEDNLTSGSITIEPSYDPVSDEVVQKKAYLDNEDGKDLNNVEDEVTNNFQEKQQVDGATNKTIGNTVIVNYFNESNEVEIRKNRTDIINEIKDFKDKRLYVTKKVRMNSEARLNKNNIQSIVLVNVYTFTILCFSIFSITNKTNSNFELLGLIVSVALFGVSLFVSLFGYREKALAFKNSYLKINDIESRLSIVILNNDLPNEQLISDFSKCKTDYNEILDKTDNHIDKDFIMFKVNSNTASVNDIRKHIYHKVTNFLIWGILYAIPIVTMLLIILALFGVIQFGSSSKPV